MAAANANTIIIKGESYRKEADAAGVIQPGDLIEIDVSLKAARQTSTGGPIQIAVAEENELFGKGLDTNYALNDRCLYSVLRSGAEWLATVEDGTAAIAVGDLLESVGNGTVKTSAKASVTVDGEADGDGDLTFTAVKEGVVGHDVEVILANAGTAGVVVAGNLITITPGSGANTATAVIAQVVANAAASLLIVATASGGDGSTEPGNATAQFLSGAGTPFAFSREAVDNSGGSAIVRMLSEVL